MNRIKPEILAPAGSMEALKAAIYAGADAVYLGGDRFGARAYASNFDKTALLEAIEYSHLYGVKVYLTINTLFRNDEIKELFDYLEPFYLAGLDAVIVQDLGVMYYVHENFPDLPIHASTQMTITTKYAYSLLKEYGVTRIVPARELSMGEITELKNTECAPEVEVFVQGALCYCYSGQCLMSSMLGGRSGNRGRCAQTCRLPYSVFDEDDNEITRKENHVLSPKDLCGLEAVPDLIQAKVDSFKIEGRMKKPEYVAACVRAYRRVIDAWFEGTFSQELIELCKSEMAEIFNRGGFTKGYYYQKNGKDMMSVKNPGNTGVVIGTVVQTDKKSVDIRLDKEVFHGDILVLEGRKAQITLTCNKNEKKGNILTLNAPRTQEIIKKQSVVRMFKAPLMKELEVYSLESLLVPISGKIELKEGLPAKLIVSAQIREKQYQVVQNGSLVEAAAKNPISEEIVLDKIGKTGNTRYYFEELITDISGNVFYSLKALKDLRRNAIQLLEEQIISSYLRTAPTRKEVAVECVQKKSNRNVSAMVSNWEQYQTICKDGRISNIYLDLQYFEKMEIVNILQKGSECRFFLVFPPVLRKNALKEMQEMLELLKKNEITCSGVVIRNLDELAYLSQTGYRGEVITDYSLYAMNDYAVHVIRNCLSDAVITIPVELNQGQIRLLKYPDTNCELQVYGYQQLMVSAQCIQNTLRKCNQKNVSLQMKDRYHKSFFVFSICKYCYNLIYNGIPTVLFDLVSKKDRRNATLRLHFTKENQKEVQLVLESFFHQQDLNEDRTRGHYNRGVE